MLPTLTATNMPHSTTYYSQKQQPPYRVGQVVVHLGWVDLDLGSSLGWWATTVATYCPCRLVEYVKPKSTQPRCTTTCPTLYYMQTSHKWIAPRPTAWARLRCTWPHGGVTRAWPKCCSNRGRIRGKRIKMEKLRCLWRGTTAIERWSSSCAACALAAAVTSHERKSAKRCETFFWSYMFVYENFRG